MLCMANPHSWLVFEMTILLSHRGICQEDLHSTNLALSLRKYKKESMPYLKYLTILFLEGMMLVQ